MGGATVESLKLHPQVVDFAGVAAFRSLCSAVREEECTEHRWQLVVEYDAAERSQKNFRPWWLPRRAAALIKFFEPLLSPDLKNICSVVPCFSLSFSLWTIRTSVFVILKLQPSAGCVKSSTSLQETALPYLLKYFEYDFITWTTILNC